MQLGLAGFRVDAVPFLIETVGIIGGAEELPQPHDYLRHVRAFMNRRSGDAVLLGEVNLPHQQAREFFGDEDGDELTMLFDFPTMQAMYLGLARQDAGPIRTALMGRPESPRDSQWAVFARNHDELTLDKLSMAERQEVFDAFGPDPEMQLYSRGLRRRLPPMLDGDAGRIRLVYSLMMSLPGTPTLFYGEEIGMGENLQMDGRMAVRTPMQWHPGKMGGFSTATDPALLCRPFPAAPYGPDQVNVVTQRRDPDSLFSFLRERIRCYRECPELGWGALTVLDHNERSVLAHRCDWDDGALLLCHNLGGNAVTVKLSILDQPRGSLCVDLFDRSKRLPIPADGSLDIDLDAFGARWFRLANSKTAELF
jgi:glycosidase